MYIVNTEPATRRCACRSIRCPATSHGDDRIVSSSTSTRDGRAAADGAGLPSRHAQRQHQRPRLQLEPGRLRSSRSPRSRATTSRRGCASPTRATGAVRTVLDEKVATHYESRTGWQVLWATNEVIWYSRARRLGPPLSLRPATGAAETPDYHRPGPGHADRHASTRRHARSGSAPAAASRDAIRTSRASSAVGLDGRAGRVVALTPDDGIHACSCRLPGGT